MAEVVVRHGNDGTVTVCIGEECVTVPCPAPKRKPGGPLIGIEKVADVLGDVEALDWEQVAPGVEMADDRDAWLERRRD